MEVGDYEGLIFFGYWWILVRRYWQILYYQFFIREFRRRIGEGRMKVKVVLDLLGFKCSGMDRRIVQCWWRVDSEFRIDIGEDGQVWKLFLGQRNGLEVGDCWVLFCKRVYCRKGLEKVLEVGILGRVYVIEVQEESIKEESIRCIYFWDIFGDCFYSEFL